MNIYLYIKNLPNYIISNKFRQKFSLYTLLIMDLSGIIFAYKIMQMNSAQSYTALEVLALLSIANIIFFLYSKKINIALHIVIVIMIIIELILFFFCYKHHIILFLFLIFPVFAVSSLGNYKGTFYSILLIVISGILLQFVFVEIENEYLHEVSNIFVFAYITELSIINLYEYANRIGKSKIQNLLDETNEHKQELSLINQELEEKQEIIQIKNQTLIQEFEKSEKVNIALRETNEKLEKFKETEKLYVKKLLQSNEETKSLNEELIQQNEEIQSINDTLQDKASIINKQNAELTDTLEIVQRQQERLYEISKDINSGLQYAKTIQDSILPSKEIIDNCFDEYFILFEPKQIVSGDFYFVHKVGDFIVFAVADCTGHGIPGGFLTMLASTFIYDIVKRGESHSTGETLELLRNRIKEIFLKSGNVNNNGLDIAFCAIDTKTNQLQYSGAFNPLIIIRNEEILEFKAVRNPIGFYPVENNFKTNYIQLLNNDKIYIFSDGFYDQIGMKTDKKFNYRKFRELLFNIHGMPMNMQQQILLKILRNWKGALEQIDDITVMGINWKTNNN